MNLAEKRIATIAIGPIWIFLTIYLLQLCSYVVLKEQTLSLTLLAVFSVALLPRVLFGERDLKSSLFALASSTALIIGCFVVSTSIYDSSYDGQIYHQLAVNFLEKGWDFYSADLTPLLQVKLEYQLPLRHYPKFPWLVESVISRFTSNIEGAKSLNLVFLICSGLLTYLAAINLGLSKLASRISALALALNPVSICQLWTFYIDGLLASMTLFLFAALSLYLSSRQKIWLHLAGFSLVILTHIKFTALVIVGSLFVILLIALLKKSQGALKSFRILSGYLFVGVVVIGWHPYATNFFSTGNPIYPIAGYSPIGRTPQPKDWPSFPIIHGQQPEVVKDLFGPTKTLVSIFSRVADPLNPSQENDFFWSGHLSDFSRFIAPDLRLGAFGPLFAPILIASLLGSMNFRKSEVSSRALLLALVVVISSILNPESWWFRYSPHLWLLPFLFGATSKSSKLTKVVFLTLTLSSIVILFVNTRAAYKNSLAIKGTLASLADYSNSSLPGNMENYFANELRLKRLNIKVTPANDCSDKTYFAGSNSYVCLSSPVVIIHNSATW